MILANNFERVQIIPGAVHNYIRISCLDCSTDTGKIAAAYENQVCIFEPTPLIHSTCSHVCIDTLLCFIFLDMYFKICLETLIKSSKCSFTAIRIQMGSNRKSANRIEHYFFIMEFRRNKIVNRWRIVTVMASKYYAISRRA